MSDRKYRHRGYQDSGRGDRDFAPREKEPRPKPGEGPPRGRSVGSEAETAFKCAGCGQTVRLLETVSPETTCAHCSADLHSCANCKNYDGGAFWECRVKIPKAILAKRRRNECGEFAPRLVIDLTGQKAEGVDDARSAFDKLFGK